MRGRNGTLPVITYPDEKAPREARRKLRAPGLQVASSYNLVPPPTDELDAPAQKIDPRPLIDDALQRAASGILSFVRQSDKWGSGRQFHHQLITGAGAEALRSQLSEAFPRAYIMPEPVLVNAIGLARLAQQAFE